MAGHPGSVHAAGIDEGCVPGALARHQGFIQPETSRALGALVNTGLLCEETRNKLPQGGLRLARCDPKHLATLTVEGDAYFVPPRDSHALVTRADRQ